MTEIQVETTPQVEKLMATDNFGAIIINHLLQSPGRLAPIISNVEKAVYNAIQSRGMNILR